MKRIYSILFSIVALVVFVPRVNAQTDWSMNGVFSRMEGYTGAPEFATEKVNEYTGVSLGKTISKPVNGTYWLKLEAFATGSGIQSTVVKPSDIVLVLDLSSSMRYSYKTSTTEWYEYDQGYFYNYFQSSGNNSTPDYYYKDDDGNYHEVTVSQSGGRYRLSYTSGDTTYYLTGTTVTTTAPNDGPQAANGIIWTGKLYSHDETRLHALQDAVRGFINTIYENAVQAKQKDDSFGGNRIAIVTYSGDTNTSGSNQHEERQIYNITNGFKDVTQNQTSLLDLVSGLDLLDERGDENSGTRPELGLNMAISILGSKRPADEASATVVLFTDGYPVQIQDNTNWPGQGSGSDRFTYEIANDAVYYASQIKQSGVKMFTVGLIVDPANTDVARANYQRVLYMMDVISSNYPNAGWGDSYTLGTETAWTVSGTTVSVSGLQNVGNADKDPDGDFFQLVGDTDLSAIFDTIAQQSGASEDERLTEETETIDVISSSFVLPEGTSANDILVFTAPYILDGSTLKFGPDTLANHSNGTFVDYEMIDGVKTEVDPAKDIDDDIEPTISGNTVTISGFDYSDNWCGPVKTGDVVTGAHGRKLIILIPIQMSDDAVGGPNVKTNAPGSGIKIPGGEVLGFPEPDVSLPINIHIKTTGLSEGESAKYRIMRKSEAPGATWEYVSTVFVTCHKGKDYGIVKVKGLPSATKIGNTEYDYVYRVIDEGWSWSYDLTKVSGIGAADADNPEGKPFDITANFDTDVTTDRFIVNPITFVNSKVQGVNSGVRHAESKAANKFSVQSNTGTYSAGSVGYDDSKGNNRTVITTEVF